MNDKFLYFWAENAQNADFAAFRSKKLDFTKDFFVKKWPRPKWLHHHEHYTSEQGESIVLLIRIRLDVMFEILIGFDRLFFKFQENGSSDLIFEWWVGAVLHVQSTITIG